MAAQIEETLKRIQTSDGVIGFVIVNNAGMLFEDRDRCRHVPYISNFTINTSFFRHSD